MGFFEILDNKVCKTSYRGLDELKTERHSSICNAGGLSSGSKGENTETNQRSRESR
jgi:hypothetical protein